MCGRGGPGREGCSHVSSTELLQRACRSWLGNRKEPSMLPAGNALWRHSTLPLRVRVLLQCGSQQQLRRALELVAEMRSRGIQCNVHTYSALMNVCIKGKPPPPASCRGPLLHLA
jgi:pentatricopeptide repeat protein